METQTVPTAKKHGISFWPAADFTITLIIHLLQAMKQEPFHIRPLNPEAEPRRSGNNSVN
jgi:hypothetical protein